MSAEDIGTLAAHVSTGWGQLVGGLLVACPGVMVSEIFISHTPEEHAAQCRLYEKTTYSTGWRPVRPPNTPPASTDPPEGATGPHSDEETP